MPEGQTVRPAVAVALLAALVWTALLAAVIHMRWDGDPRALLFLGSGFSRPQAFDGIPREGPWGYDGQFYAVLATDPLLQHRDTVESLDAPGYRALRIGIPVLAWALALGHAGTAIVLYQLLCWSLTLAAVAVLGLWLRDSGHSPWWALLLAAQPGVATSMFRSTVDGAAVGAILLSLLLHRRGRTGWSVAALVAAALVRETSLLAAAAVAVTQARRGRWGAAVLAGGLPTATLLGWRALLSWRLGDELATGMGNFAAPLSWLPRQVERIAALGQPWGALETCGLVGLLLLLAGLGAGVVGWRAWGAAEWTLAAFGALALSLSRLVYVEVFAYSRVLLPLAALAIPFALKDRVAWRRQLVLAGLGVWALTGGLIARIELLAAVHAPSALVRQDSVDPGHLRDTVTRTVLVAPVVHRPGWGGGPWSSDLELYNPTTEPLALSFELLGPGGSHNPPPVSLLLAGQERRSVQDALQTLFGAKGSGALRVRGPTGPWWLSTTTRDVGRSAASDPLPVLSPLDALTAERPALLAGLPVGPGAGRVILGVVNLGPARLTVDCDLVTDMTDHSGWRLSAPRDGARHLKDLLSNLPAPTEGVVDLDVRLSPERARALVYAAVVGPEPGALRLLYATPR